MELGADHGAAPDDGGDRPAIVDMGQKVGVVGQMHLIRMNKIGVIAGFYASQNRVGPVDHQIVPAHMRHLDGRVSRCDPRHLAAQPAETRRVAVLAAQSHHHLHPDADTQKRAAPVNHRLFNRIKQPRHGIKCCPARRKSTIAGQHDPVSPGNIFGPRGDHHLTAAGFRRHSFKRLGGRMQVAAVVIDQRRQHL